MTKWSDFWKSNIDRPGRKVRAICGAVFLLSGLALGIYVRWWLGVAVSLAGAFMIFEAARGWCIVRAMGFRTRI
jgi:hypothetical protein